MKSSGALLLLGSVILSKDMLLKNTPFTSSTQPFTSSTQPFTSSKQPFTSYKQPFTSSTQPLTSSKLLENNRNKIKTRDQHEYMILNGEKFTYKIDEGGNYSFDEIPPLTIIDKAKKEPHLSIFVKLLEITKVFEEAQTKAGSSDSVITILVPNDNAFKVWFQENFQVVNYPGSTHYFINKLEEEQTAHIIEINKIKSLLQKHIIISTKGRYTASVDTDSVDVVKSAIKAPGIHSINLTRIYKNNAAANLRPGYKVVKMMQYDTAAATSDKIEISVIKDPREDFHNIVATERRNNPDADDIAHVPIIGWKAKLSNSTHGEAILVKTDITAPDGIIHVINKVL
jgi:hypothetical protein